MKKLTISLCILGFALTAKAQVGVNTTYPRGIFNVDGAKNNTTATDAPTIATESTDDVVVEKETGNVGIGTATPAVKLDIETAGTSATPVAGFKLADGTQAANRVLMSNADGVGSWRTPASIKPVAFGTFPIIEQFIVSDGGTAPKYTQVSIELSRGKWVVNAGLTMLANYNTANNGKYWIHSYLSSSTTSVQQTGFTHLGPSGTNTCYAGIITNSGGVEINFINGASVIDVTAETVTLYLFIENAPIGRWQYPTGAYENYFYAVPVN